eukprot:CAMPEP_0194598080 /NCGR_PEP_ID=MMETSP0292-20121207/26767_1 /TAXON_ID=39354 /ORGANISM="Heterosigma akashiwo, Strain CCMP2393" /LENGTH=46 /DNA_ID= /DNA_START= /DNA_END= /DNA_ORIENTATION=
MSPPLAGASPSSRSATTCAIARSMKACFSALPPRSPHLASAISAAR